MLEVDEKASDAGCMRYELSRETNEILINSVIDDDDLLLAEDPVIKEAVSHMQTLLPNVTAHLA